MAKRLIKNLEKKLIEGILQTPEEGTLEEMSKRLALLNLAAGSIHANEMLVFFK